MFCVVFVEFSGPSYKQTIQLSGCLVQSGSSCFNQVIVRVRRNASDNVDMSTTPSTSRPILSSTVNMSLELTPDQSNYSSRHNASLQWSASQLPVNTTVHPANVTNNSNAILEVSSFYFKITLSSYVYSYHFYRAMHFSAKRGIAIACRPSVRPSVTLVNCDHIGWNSSKIISPLVCLGRSLFATPTRRVCSKGNTPKFSPE